MSSDASRDVNIPLHHSILLLHCRSDGFNFNLMSKKSDVDAEVSLSDKNL